MRTKVLYLCAGDPVEPKSGMDVVAREHLRELRSRADLDVSAVYVRSGAERQKALQADGSYKINGFDGEECRASGATLQLRKLRFLAEFRLLSAFNFRSRSAQRALLRHLNSGPDAVVLDHASAIVNFPWRLLFAYRKRIVFISHDNDFYGLLDYAKLRPALISKCFFALQAVQGLCLQMVLVRFCRATVFISGADYLAFRALAPKRTIPLCPVLTPGLEQAPSQPLTSSRYVVFLGSPAFGPNQQAITWLVRRLAPALLALSADLRVLLVGKGTDQLPEALPQNVSGLGFLPEADLQEVLQQSVGLVSPIIHGSGLKIKVLEALAVGCPILAAAESLRGFEFMQICPQLHIDKPGVSAANLLAFANSDAAQLAERARLKMAWSDYQRRRTGKLADLAVCVGGPVGALESELRTAQQLLASHYPV